MKKTIKKLGIWMDHSMAHLMEFSNDPFEVATIESQFTPSEKELRLAESESVLPTKEKRLLRKYYTKLAEAVKNYQQVILFGPTDAKIEFFDALSEDDRYLKIKIEIKDTDRMTRTQQHHFINEYFMKN
jgi:ADP-heptose:LPS heptosyltransferase